MIQKSGILADTTELKKLILEHPDYPLCVLGSDDLNIGDYGWMYATKITFELGEILDCSQDVDCDCTFNDREEFYEKLEDWLYERLNEEFSMDGEYLGDNIMSEEEFQTKLAEEKAKYEPHWKKCIIIYADN
ncbi:MAG: hypothetical protein MSA90_22165 [Faecalicatena sp.]|uniref:hypothetical protein n=1 Tax=Faecalicatena sp. TaxID=2005360 RepID=UPI00258C931F|nr:hypothetical protein [Faecalicatena sp.]MCI6468156.1 hypothetical protein [Faecalicatena sp.]MDY5620410.1 hypothetical protein [Lachnospiraceae bacterium]